MVTLRKWQGDHITEVAVRRVRQYNQKAGLSLRAGDRGFPMSTMNVTSG